MKLEISEKQLKLILSNQVESELGEQESPVNPEPTAGTSSTQTGGQGYPEVGKWESGVTRGPGNQVGVTKWSDVVGSTLQRGKSNPLKEQSGVLSQFYDKNLENWVRENPHQAALVYGLAADFVPYIGPLLSLGIGLYDTQLYYKEKDYQNAGMSAVFSLIPGLQIAKKIPLVAGKALTKAGFKNLGEKLIAKAVKFSPEEVKVLNFIAKYRKEIEAELKNSAQKTIKQARQKIQNKIVRTSMINKTLSGGGKLIGTTSLGYGAGETLNNYEIKKQEQLQAQSTKEFIDFLSQYENISKK